MDNLPPPLEPEDDTPRKFRELMSTVLKKRRKKNIGPKKIEPPKEDDIWTVRPGESFRQFNTRIRSLGLCLPPGVPETFRIHHSAPEHNDANHQQRIDSKAAHVEDRCRIERVMETLDLWSDIISTERPRPLRRPRKSEQKGKIKKPQRNVTRSDIDRHSSKKIKASSRTSNKRDPRHLGKTKSKKVKVR